MTRISQVSLYICGNKQYVQTAGGRRIIKEI